MSDSEGAPNRLAASSSPYLLQHAHNPVDWYPWGDEAIEAARSSGRPIFLSVGYSTCHWCHVMERESFEHPDTAALMNERFINIKVDREEHPDVDQIYMAVVQAMTGHGGWPMSVFLTPDLTPYFAGTYFPPEPRYGHPAFRQILERCAAAWESEPEKVAEHGRGVMKWFEERESKAVPDGERIVSRGAIERCVKELRHGFDAHHGGFGGAPKFPRSMTLMLLLRHRLATEGEDDTLEMVEKTLEMMWRGGLWDHVGHGFARYSTDERWLVPHFEKMLYDNALLAMSYAEAWQVTGNDDWRAVGTQTLDWVLAEMTHAEGGFFSAQDADSEGEEGKFYVWSPDELEAALGAADAEFVSRVWGVDPYGNFEGKSILYLPKTLDDTAAVLEMTREELCARLEPLREKLYAVRDARIHPGLDDKVLTSWNGLMIAAMARCGATFGEARFVAAARAAAAFARENLSDGDAGLLRRWREGDAALTGTLEDFAFFAWGLLELFEATSEPEWLAWAERLVEEALHLFHDDEKGGFFFTREGESHLVVRMKEPYDGATPSGNSVMALNLLRLADLRDVERYRGLADRTIAAFGDHLSRMPSAYPLMLCALERALTPPVQVVIAGEGDRADALLRRARATFSPHAAVVHVRDDNREALAASMPWLAGKDPVDGAPAAWVCRQFTCELPVTSPEALGL